MKKQLITIIMASTKKVISMVWTNTSLINSDILT